MKNLTCVKGEGAIVGLNEADDSWRSGGPIKSVKGPEGR